MNEPEEILVEVARGIEANQRGERDEARRLFASLWRRVGEDGDPLHRCAIAHSMADAQDDPADELAWDLRALDAAGLVTDERVRRAGMDTTAAGMFPSLHLNLGEAYRKVGELEQARHHLARGRAATGALGDGGYARMISGALDALAERLG